MTAEIDMLQNALKVIKNIIYHAKLVYWCLRDMIEAFYSKKPSMIITTPETELAVPINEEEVSPTTKGKDQNTEIISITEILPITTQSTILDELVTMIDFTIPETVIVDHIQTSTFVSTCFREDTSTTDSDSGDSTSTLLPTQSNEENSNFQSYFEATTVNPNTSTTSHTAAKIIQNVTGNAHDYY